LSDHRRDMRLTADLHLWDEANVGAQSIFSEKTAARPRMPVCSRFKAQSIFASGLADSGPGTL